MPPTKSTGNFYASKRFQELKKKVKAIKKTVSFKAKDKKKAKGKGQTLGEEPSTSAWRDPVRERFPELTQEDRNNFAGILAIEAAPDQRQLGRDSDNNLALVQRSTRALVRHTENRADAVDLVRTATTAIRRGGDILSELVQAFASGFTDHTQIVDLRQETRVQNDIFQEEGQNLLAIQLALEAPSTVAVQFDQERTPAVKRALDLTVYEEQAARTENAKRIIQEVIDETDRQLAIEDTMSTEAPVPMETSENGAAAAPQQRAAGGGGGGGGGGSGGESAGYGKNPSDAFQRHRNKPIDLKHIGNNVYVSQRVYKVEAECKLVDDRLTWTNTDDGINIRRLMGFRGDYDDVDTKFNYKAKLAGSIQMGNLELGNYISAWGLDHISKSEDSWAIIATRGKMNHLQAFEMVPQLNGETVIGYNSVPVQFGKLLGHIYYPDPKGNEQLKVACFGNGKEGNTFKGAKDGLVLDDDMTQQKITTDDDFVYVFTDLRDAPMMSRTAIYEDDAYANIKGVGIEHQGFDMTSEAGTALIGVMPSRCISKRKEIQSGMDNIVLWAMKSNRLIDKRFWTPEGWSSKSVNGMAQDRLDIPTGNKEIYAEAHVTRTSDYAEWARNEAHYDATVTDDAFAPANEGRFTTKYNISNQYATQIFFMPYVHTQRGAVQDIVVNFDLTLQIMIKKIPRTVYNDFYHINARAYTWHEYNSTATRTYGVEDIRNRATNIHHDITGTHGSKYSDRGPIKHKGSTMKIHPERAYAQKRIFLDKGISKRTRSKTAAAADDDIPDDCDDFLETSEMRMPPQPQLSKKKKKPKE